jgi:hypothetical protein
MIGDQAAGGLNLGKLWHAPVLLAISAPFQHGLAIAFDFAIAACLIAAVASLLRGSRYVHELHGASPAPATVPHGTGRPLAITAADPVTAASGSMITEGLARPATEPRYGTRVERGGWPAERPAAPHRGQGSSRPLNAARRYISFHWQLPLLLRDRGNLRAAPTRG